MSRSDVEKDAVERLRLAREEKQHVAVDIEEAYFFTAPMRKRSMQGRTVEDQPRGDQNLLQTEIGHELATDFATLVMTTFMPDTTPWAVRMPRLAARVDNADLIALRNKAKEQDGRVFDEIKASNFYEEAAKGLSPDIGLGTVGCHIDAGRLDRPPVARWVPLSEVELRIGHDGCVDDRFIVRHTSYERLAGMLRGVELPRTFKKKGREKCTVTWGWWRDWTDDADEVWRQVVLVDDKLVGDGDELRGEGAMPFIVGRFGAAPELPFGYGPTLQCLPGLRYLDELRGQSVAGIDRSISPPSTYPHDAWLELKNPIESGMMLPLRSGEREAVGQLYPPPNLDPAFFDEERSERRMKRLHFLDQPQQRGDTPPTLGQWTSEIEMTMRRIGVPGRVFWHEFCGPVFRRFVRIMEDKGQLEPLTLNGERVRMEAINPAQRSQDMQDVANASRVIEIGAAAFPEEWKAGVDGMQTIKNFSEKVNDGGIIAFRSEDQIAGAVDMIGKLMGGAAAGGAPGAAGLAGVAP